MYGSDDNNGQQPGGNTPPPIIDTPMSNSMNDGSNTPNDNGMDNPDPDAANDAGSYMMTDPPVAPIADAPVAENSNDTDDVDRAFDDSNAAEPTQSDDNTSSSDDLLNLKQQALSQLAPLVDHLDQSPEDEFRTTMMMIQASDNKALLPKAYEAAQKITDDKVKAQALLDVINEINYFTQSQNNDQ